MTDDLVEAFELALLATDRVAAERVVAEAAEHLVPERALEGLMTPVLDRIGRLWESGNVALSQVYMAGRICEALGAKLLPDRPTSTKHHPRAAITILNDYHLLGKRIVHSMLRANGFVVRDFGRTTAPQLVERVLAEEIEILLISALMLPSALEVRQVVDGLRAAGATTRVVVGGAPFRFDERLSEEVGADAMGRNAADALAIMGRLTAGGADE